MIKKIIFILLLASSFNTKAQEGLKIGAELSPAWNISMQRNNNTGLLSNTNGYGFNIGVPVKWGFSETMSLQTGLTFEMMLFDNRVNKQLVSSNRHGSLNLPIMLNYGLSGGWYLMGGIGLNYNFLNTGWTQIAKFNISSTTNVFQPYLALGISTLMERDFGTFELGAQGRFHFIDLYKNDVTGNNISTWILSLDLVLRYYLWSNT